jgi:transcription elongation factor Elf1
MKKFVCEMCGNSDLIKQDEFFVCQYCGTKYEPEVAKKLMVEVDNSKQLANLYERARKSIEVDDLEHAAEYYKQIR